MHDNYNEQINNNTNQINSFTILKLNIKMLRYLVSVNDKMKLR